ncbi:MAG TPA: ATP-binding cassette domain-containing protein, partial [candidate division Zixibacteria bacterium]|nr:ATP-binding cassette domain-containing protein [candidate division Zixibacteria bacterium]
MPDTAIVELSNVDLAYPRSGELFRNLSLSVRPGETAVITGGPGSGKTTIAELLVGRKFADAGSVEVFGENLRRGRG